MVQLFEELKRRNVFRVGIAYVVTAWLVIQVVETIFPAFGFGDAAIRTAVIVLAIGFPLVLIFSWLFQLTPEGLKLDRDVDRSGPVLPHTGKKLDRAIIVVLTLALGYFAIDKFVIDPARDAAREVEIAEQAQTEAIIGSFGQNSLAVLPFVNMSNDVENEYFSDGVAEEVLNLLAKIPDLRVISRSSSFSFRGKDIDIPSIAEQLNVALVLEGSVRRYGDQVRITAQLIEARSDTHLWSETYERELVDVFAIQDEISAAIVESLKGTIDLQVDEAPRTTAVNTEAHDAYLRGQYLLAQRNVTGAAREFEKAISLDPDYALAHAQLAIAYQLRGFDTRAPAHVEKAMTLDPSIAEAHAAAGLLSSDDEDFQSALGHFEKALEIKPSYADVYTWMANMLEFQLGRYAEADAMRESAVQLDPLSLPGRVNYVITLIETDRLTEADRELEKLASLAPDHYAAHRGMRLSQGGNWAEFALGLLGALQITPDSGRFRFALAYALAIIGLEEEALAVREEADPDLLRFLGKPRQAAAAAQESLAEDPISRGDHAEVGLVLASAGEFARARPHLEASWQGYGGRIVGFGFGVDHVAALIAVRRAAGEADNVADLLEAIRDNVRRYREAGIATSADTSPDYEDGLASYLAGDEQPGLALIARAVEDGYFIPPREAYLQSLYEHPDFAPVRAMQEARQARERERFLAVVCSDNPYAAVWQPAEGTCERFTAESGS
jgi:TolB-like protein/Flp pilus assembly protein TadD